MSVLRILFLAISFLSIAAAQNAAVQGIVTDASGAAIPLATVRIENLGTGISTTTTASPEGRYSFPSLPPGTYRIESIAEGFGGQQLAEFQLEVSQVARLDFRLQPGTVVESVQVSAAAVLLNSETTEVGQVIDSKRILEMPLNGRNYLQLAQFTAGALPGGGDGTGARGRGEGQFAAVGMQMAQNNVLLDGNDNSSRTSGGPLGFQAQQVKPPVDAVAEFKVVTNNMSAEYGYRTGAKVLVTSKSGTNQLHGSLYEFLRNEKLDGTNFFANRSGSEKPTYRQNQFGASLGGPVFIPKFYDGRNRTFFFGSYQGTRIRFGRSYISSVPSRDIVERFDFSKQPNIRNTIFDPETLSGSGAAAVRLPFANATIPVSRIDPVSAAVAALYPTSNIAGRDDLPNNYFYSPSDADDAEQFDFRGDHNISDNHRFFVRYSLRDQSVLEPGPLPYPATGGNGQTTALKGHNLATAFTSSFSPTVLHEVRFGLSRFDTVFDILYTENLNARFGIKNAPGDTFGDGEDHGMTRFTPTGFAEVGARSFWPNRNNLHNYMVTDMVTVQAGRHTLKFGGEYRHQTIYRNAARFRRGQLAFSGAYTSQFPNVGSSRANSGNGMADMLLGWVSGGTYGNNQGEEIFSPYYGVYVQDDYKLSNRLTLNLGLRWELFPLGTFPNPENQTVARWLLAGVNVPTQADERMVYPSSSSDSGGSNDKNNFAPRLGLAWSVTDNTVIRTGAGVFYGEPNSLSTDGANFRPGAPRHTEISLQTNFETTPYRVKEGFPAFDNTVILPNVSVSVFPDYRPNLLAYQWFFDLQRTLPGDTLFTIGYVGTKAQNIYVSRNLNLPYTPSANVAANQRRIRPQFNAISYSENSLHSNYHALTAKAEKRFSRGLTYLASFTYSKNIDQGTESLFDGSQDAATPYNLQIERGRSNLDRTLGFISSVVYELPFGKGRTYLRSGPASWVLGGWQLGGIVSLYSGFPVPHTFNVNNQNLGGPVRGDWVRNPNLPTSERTIDRWFDTGFVTASAPGVLSNAGRNLVESPGTKNLDVMVARNFLLPWEGHQLQLRFESFNFTNTPNFGRPNTAVGTPNAGAITTASEPRRIQFGLKYVF
jgi:hypothetical protein